MNYEWLSIARCGLIVSHAGLTVQKFATGLLCLSWRKRISYCWHSFRASYRSDHLRHASRLSSRYSTHRRAVRWNDFNEAASITSVNRARALTGDLRLVARARESARLCLHIARENTFTSSKSSTKILTSIIHSVASDN